MKCELIDLGKSYNHFPVFRKLNYTIESGGHYVILGGNGSGKSTLLKIIAGGVDPTEGVINYLLNSKSISRSNLPQHISFCSPYMDVIEEFTFKELIDFQSKFKPFSLNKEEILEISRLRNIDDKLIRHFSSGMKQRVKLTLAFAADVDMVLLDEPTSNLDQNGKKWYRKQLDRFGKDKTVVVASNHQEEEYPSEPNFIDITDYKQ